MVEPVESLAVEGELAALPVTHEVVLEVEEGRVVLVGAAPHESERLLPG